jgi:hypothetical protein
MCVLLDVGAGRSLVASLPAAPSAATGPGWWAARTTGGADGFRLHPGMRYLYAVRPERRFAPYRDALSCGNGRTTDIRASARGIRVTGDLLVASRETRQLRADAADGADAGPPPDPVARRGRGDDYPLVYQ